MKMAKNKETYILLSDTPIIIKKNEENLIINSAILHVDLFSNGLKTLTNIIEIAAIVPM